VAAAWLFCWPARLALIRRMTRRWSRLLLLLLLLLPKASLMPAARTRAKLEQ